MTPKAWAYTINCAMVVEATRRLTFAAQASIKNEYLRITRAPEGVIFSEHDLRQCLGCTEFQEHTVSCFWIHNDRINPSLSFHLELGVIEKLESVRTANQKLLELGYKRTPKESSIRSGVMRRENYLIVSDRLHEHEEDFSSLIDCLSIAASRSINSTNAIINLNRRTHAKLSNIVSKNHGDDFQELVSKAAQVLCDLSHRQVFTFEIFEGGDARVSSVHLPKDTEGVVMEGLSAQLLEAIVNANTSPLLASANESITLQLAYPAEQKEQPNAADTPEVTSHVIAHKIDAGGRLANGATFVGMTLEAEVRNENVLHLASFSSSFEEVFLRTRRLSLISNLRRKAKTATPPDAGQTYSNIRNDFENFIAEHFEHLFSLTNCHSATLRLFDPCTNSLQLVKGVSSSEAGTFDYLEEDSAISLKKFRDSANAFTFLIGHQHSEYTYIRNMNSRIPAEYKALGLNSAFATRPKTLSEVCMPFFFQETVIGTINIEAPQKSAFDDDLDFLLMFKSSLEDYYRQLFEVEDLGWTRQLTRFADPMHELSNYLDSGFFDKQQRAVLEKLFFSSRAEDSGLQTLTLGQLQTWLSHWVHSYFDKESSDLISVIEGIVEINGPRDTALDPAASYIVRSIIRNLVINIVNYSYIDADKVLVSASGLFGLRSRSDEIRVRLKSFGPFDDQDLEVLCLRPIKRPYDVAKPEHFGMYSLGLLVRSVGGHVTICPASQYDETIIEFKIPNGRSGHDKTEFGDHRGVRHSL